jgi:glycosyltransferase involved in cell wall biosynthesis
MPAPIVEPPLVSILTPTYNSEVFLAECIESVLAQTHENWEYLIVDDASTDRTVELALSYAAQDPRIGVHRHANRLGVPANWNRTLRYLSPDSVYCKFVHADDSLYPQCIQRMVECAEANPSAGIISAYRLDGTRVNLDGLDPERTFFPGEEILRSTLMGGFYVFGSPTSLLLRSENVRAHMPLYDESTLHADTEACFDLLRDSDLGFVHEVLTFTRRHKGAVTNYASWLGTYRPSQLRMHQLHGRVFLSQAEYERRLATLLVDYVRFLGKRLPRFRDKAFRSYHRKVLSDLRANARLTEVMRGAGLQLREKTRSIRG